MRSGAFRSIPVIIRTAEQRDRKWTSCEVIVPEFLPLVRCQSCLIYCIKLVCAKLKTFFPGHLL